MNINKIINNYTETNNFEINYKNEKLKISYYEDILNFNEKRIDVIGDKKLICVNGNNLIIESLFKEFVIIKGDIKSISLEDYHE